MFDFGLGFGSFFNGLGNSGYRPEFSLFGNQPPGIKPVPQQPVATPPRPLASDTINQQAAASLGFGGDSPEMRLAVAADQKGSGLLPMFGGAGVRSAVPLPTTRPVQTSQAAPSTGQSLVFSARSKARPSNDLSGILQEMTAKYDLPPGYLTRTAQIESSFNPRAMSPTGAAGLFQFTKGTAQRMGLGDRFDPIASADAAARLAAENKEQLAGVLGRQPTPSELYLSHQQGVAGAEALLTHPGMNAVDALSIAYNGDRSAAERAIRANGGSADMTAGQFAQLWSNKFGGSQSAPVQVAQNAPSNAPQTGPEAAKLWQPPPIISGLTGMTDNASATTPNQSPGITRERLAMLLTQPRQQTNYPQATALPAMTPARGVDIANDPVLAMLNAQEPGRYVPIPMPT